MKHLLKIFYLTIFNISLFTQPTVEWWKSLGDSIFAGDYCFGACLSHDGGYLVTGYTNDHLGGCNHGTYDFWVVKLSNAGEIQWHKCYGGSLNEIASSILPTIDGGYILGGGTWSNDGDVSNKPYTNVLCGWIVKIDSIGNLEWQKCVCDTITTGVYFLEVQPIAANGYIAAGYITDFYNYEALLIRFNSNGEIIWQRKLGGSNKDVARHITPTSDNGFIVTGYTYSSDGDLGCNYGDMDGWIMKLDSIGNIEWQQCIGGTWEDSPYWVTQTSDGGYIVAGNTLSSDGDFPVHYGVYDAFLAKLSPTGNIEWIKMYGGSFDDAFISVIQSHDGNYVAAGYTESNDYDVHGNHGAYDVWVVKVDTSGNVIWLACYGTIDMDWATVILQSPDKGYLAAGTHQYRVPNSVWTDIFVYYKHFYVLKLSPEIGIKENTGLPSEIICFPNPAYTEINIRLNEATNGTYCISLFDMQGKELEHIITSRSEYTLNISHLPQGVYTVRVVGNNMVNCKRIVKMSVSLISN